MSFSSIGRARANRGVALVIVLAFVVLLTGLVVAYFSRTGSDRQLAQGSFNDTKADLLAQTALAVIVGDFQQEVSSPSAVSAANIQPQRSGTPVPGSSQIPNLIRRSVRDNGPSGSNAMPSPGVPSRASSVNSEADASLNRRFVSLARWNRHYLVPRNIIGTAVDSTPVLSFRAPDWVFVLSDGPQVITAPSDVVGRYAYAVYDVGGLLDVNVAGFPFYVSSAVPPPAPTPSVALIDIGRKGSVAFADFTALGTAPTVVTPTATPTSYFSVAGINDIIGWRNYASVEVGGEFGSSSFDSPTTVSGTGSRFSAHFLNRTDGFVSTPTAVYNDRTDQSFINRSELLALRSAVNFSQNVLQYLGTFSRERNISSVSGSPRFPISLLGTVVNGAAIKEKFGLEWQSDHWRYTGPVGSTLQTNVASDASTTADFFQRLSLGMASPSISDVLTAGASVIDQYDADDVTTAIEYSGPPPPAGASPPPNPRAYGREALPSPIPAAAPSPPANFKVLNRPFRNVGEFGYAYKNATTTLDFQTSGSSDSKILDLFTYNTATPRAGTVNLNTLNIPVLAAVLMGAVTAEPPPSTPSATPTVLSRPNAIRAAAAITTATAAAAALGRQDIPKLVAAIPPAIIGSTVEAKQTVARALAEVSQTRTWNLMIDVIAQSGRYPPTASALHEFVVEGEKRYWLHIAIDRFNGEVIDQQLEAVYE